MEKNTTTDIKSRISKIADEWFLSEPLLFGTLCSHDVVLNSDMKSTMRTGQMKVEVNPDAAAEMSDSLLAEHLKVEMFRILLKHPYERVPQEANFSALGTASDVTISDNYATNIELDKASDYDFDRGLSYEEYYAKLKLIKNYEKNPNGEPLESESELAKDSSGKNKGTDQNDSEETHGVSDALDNSENGDGGKEDKQQGQSAKGSQSKNVAKNQGQADKAELWQEDESTAEKINSLIETAQKTNQWGSLSGKMASMIEASLAVKMDYKKMLAAFRQTILSERRTLTRMKPSRRYGFANMGSRRTFSTKLLVGVDTSASISDQELQDFFGVIKTFFKYGIEQLDVIQYDSKLQGSPTPIKKASRLTKTKTTGRGGTNFQPALDYYICHPEYDGLIMFTDGYAPPPTLDKARRILWVLTSKDTYEKAKVWLAKLPLSKATYFG